MLYYNFVKYFYIAFFSKYNIEVKKYNKTFENSIKKTLCIKLENIRK